VAAALDAGASAFVTLDRDCSGVTSLPVLMGATLKLTAVVLLAAVLSAPAWAQQDPRVTREREMLRRVQSQLQQAQQLAQQARAASERQAQLERELAQARAQGRTLDTQLAAQREATGACETRNAGLYDVGRALIDQCRDRSATDTLLRLEPFTGLRRVAIENMLVAQRDRLDEHRTPAAQRP